MDVEISHQASTTIAIADEDRLLPHSTELYVASYSNWLGIINNCH